MYRCYCFNCSFVDLPNCLILCHFANALLTNKCNWYLISVHRKNYTTARVTRCVSVLLSMFIAISMAFTLLDIITLIAITCTCLIFYTIHVNTVNLKRLRRKLHFFANIKENTLEELELHNNR